MDDWWYAFFITLLYIPLLFMWGFALFDLFRRQDLKGWAKILWAFAILFFPFLGVFMYFLIRPKGEDVWAPEGSLYAPGPSQYWSSRPSGPASKKDLQVLAQLHASGALSDSEYERLSQHVAATGET
jgi:hypothetical protein